MLYVIKLGGGRGLDMAAGAEDIAALAATSAQIVIVHGCSAAADQLGEELQAPPRYVISNAGVRSRYTDLATLRVFLLAAGQVNIALVQALQRVGVNALGLRGCDGSLLRGQRKDALRIRENGRQRVLRDDYTGRVTAVNTLLLRLLLGAGYVPVIAPVACSDADELLNVDGDRAASSVATALGAHTLVILSNVPGMLSDPADETSLVRSLRLHELDAYEERATGGMRRKLIASREALQGGVPRVTLGDGRRPRPLQAALAGQGTVIA
jgi:acetylglutamate/LysW-gamma-L-alpha-aminoadipate kinase